MLRRPVQLFRRLRPAWAVLTLPRETGPVRAPFLMVHCSRSRSRYVKTLKYHCLVNHDFYVNKLPLLDLLPRVARVSVALPLPPAFSTRPQPLLRSRAAS